MASNERDYIMGARTKHQVGGVTSWRAPQLFINGALVKETGGIDNYTMVELFYEDNVAKVKYATASATAENVFLVTTPEVVLTKSFSEKLCDFYNANGELATIAYFEKGMSFETSAVDGLASIAVGDYCVWDATKKKFAKKATPATTDIKVFQVTSKETDERYLIDDMSVLELTVVR